MKNIFKILALGIVAIFTSCINDSASDCPPLKIKLVVKDKNYFNVDLIEWESRKDESLAFQEYVPMFSYLLVDLETGLEVASSTVTISNTTKQDFDLEFGPDIGYGKYSLIIWGGHGDEHQPSKGFYDIDLLKTSGPGSDIYLSQEFIDYAPSSENHMLELERVKGKLLVYVENLPSKYLYVRSKISNVFGILTSGLDFGEATDIELVHELGSEDSHLMALHLPPSLKLSQNKLSLDLLQEDGVTPTIQSVSENLLNNISLKINRNEITALKITYQGEPDGGHSILALIDSRWEQLHNSEID